MPGRIFAESKEDISKELRHVFGIVNFSVAEQAESYEELKTLLSNLLAKKDFKTFRITASRIDKSFPKTSEEIAREMGAFVAESMKKKVDLENFDLNIQIEIAGKPYVFFEKISCFGGLPVGVEGKVLCFLENYDGIAAAFLVMKRGCDIMCASIKDFDISKLSLFSPDKINFFKINSFEELEAIARNENAKAIVVGDRLENIKDYKTRVFVMRPLIGMEENEIKGILEKIS